MNEVVESSIYMNEVVESNIYSSLWIFVRMLSV